MAQVPNSGPPTFDLFDLGDEIAPYPRGGHSPLSRAPSWHQQVNTAFTSLADPTRMAWQAFPQAYRQPGPYVTSLMDARPIPVQAPPGRFLASIGVPLRPWMETYRPGPPEEGDGLYQNAVAGLNTTAYGLYGLPADLGSLALNAPGYLSNSSFGTHFKPVIEDHPLGSQAFARYGEKYLGIPNPNRVKAVTTGEKLAHNTGMGVGLAMLPEIAWRGGAEFVGSKVLPWIDDLFSRSKPAADLTTKAVIDGAAPKTITQTGRVLENPRTPDVMQSTGVPTTATTPPWAYRGRGADLFDSIDTVAPGKPYQDFTSGILTGKELPPRQVFYHYTNERGLNGITTSNNLNPSLWYRGTKDVRYGNGQYVSDIVPGTLTPRQLSAAFLRNPWQGSRFTHYIEIDATGLGAINGRPGVYVIRNEAPLDLTGRILRSGKVPGR